MISCKKQDSSVEQNLREMSEKVWLINDLLSNPPNATFPVTVQIYRGTMLLYEEKTDNKSLKIINSILKSSTTEYDIAELSGYGSDNYVGASNENVRRSAWISFSKKIER